MAEKSQWIKHKLEKFEERGHCLLVAIDGGHYGGDVLPLGNQRDLGVALVGECGVQVAIGRAIERVQRNCSEVLNNFFRF